MNKKIIVITILSIITGLVLLNIMHKESTVIREATEIVKNKNMLTMMLETEAGTGNYEEVTQSEWPQEGYVFNESLSRCENGSELSWDNEAKKVVMKSNISDKCYIYFDKYNSVNITNVTTSNITNSSITLTVTVEAGENAISKYYYSKDNGLSYEESTSNTYTFSDLSTGTEYNFKVYAEDTAGYKSNIYSISETTATTVYLADYIKGLYTTDGDNGLYYHDGIGTYTNANLEAGDNSYRYAGANPNNYVCFGSDAAACPDDNLYRIIGLFDDDKDGNYQIKLIKNNSIGEYVWNSGSNDWTKAGLNNSLNNELYWNTLSSEWQNMIASTTWHLGGMKDYNYTAKEFYNGERNNAGYGSNLTTYTDEIGLMYPSDYGYAASPVNWSTTLRNYDSATDNNWLYLGDMEWTITPNSSSSYHVFNAGISGGFGYSGPYNVYAVRPVLYLNVNVGISNGTGTRTDPYRLA